MRKKFFIIWITSVLMGIALLIMLSPGEYQSGLLSTIFLYTILFGLIVMAMMGLFLVNLIVGKFSNLISDESGK